MKVREATGPEYTQDGESGNLRTSTSFPAGITEKMWDEKSENYQEQNSQLAATARSERRDRC